MLLLCQGSYCWARNLWGLINYLFSLCFLVFGNFSLFKTPFPGWSSLPTSFDSFFVFYIFSYLFLKTTSCFSGCLMSSAGIQKLFCGIYSASKCPFDESVEENVVSPSYSSAILGPPPHFYFYLSFLSLTIVVSFVFIALFPSWHLALVLFSILCFS